MSVTEIAQIYLIDPFIVDFNDITVLPLARYWKRLIGFNKVILKSKEIKNIIVLIRFDDVAMYLDEQFERFQIYHGLYTVRVGNSSRTDSLTADITL